MNGVPAYQCQQNQPCQPCLPCPPPNAPNAVNIPPEMSGVHINIFQPSISGSGMPSYPYDWHVPSYNAGGGASSAAAAAAAAYGQNGQNGNGGNGLGQDNGANSGNGNNAGVNSGGYSYADDPHYKAKRVTVITDDLIKTLEQWLNSQEVTNRQMAAKQVLKYLEEDKRRFDDPALNALVNKMLQDPDSRVRLSALTALDSRLAQGDEYTRGVLEKMTQNEARYGQDAYQASSILLQMAAPTKLVYTPIETGNRNRMSQWQSVQTS